MKPLEVEVVNTTLLKPTRVSDGVTTIPLTIFEKITSEFFVSVAFVFATPNVPSNQTLKTALADTLSEFPYLTSKLSKDEFNQPCFLIDHDAGVLVTETKIASHLNDYLPLEPRILEVAELFPDWEGLEHVMAIKLNRFDCGGLVIGLSAHHKAGDGQSMSHFFVSWGKQARGLKIDPAPIHDQSLIKPRKPPKVEFPHEEQEFLSLDHPPKFVDPSLITNVCVHYTYEFIAKLKEKASCDYHGTKHTTFRSLTAHLWLKINEARGVDDSEQSAIIVPVNGRPKLMLPNEFFGCVVLCAYPTATAKELRQGGITYAARLIDDAVQAIGKDYFQSFIDFGAVHEGEDLVPLSYSDDNTLIPDMEVNSWLGFDFHKFDIGGGELVAFLPAFIPVEGIIILVPSPSKNKSGVNVHISMREEHAEVFKRIAHIIN